MGYRVELLGISDFLPVQYTNSSLSSCLDKDCSDTGPIKGLYLKNTRSPCRTLRYYSSHAIQYRTILHGIIRETATSANKKYRSEQKDCSGVGCRSSSAAFE